MQFTKEQIEQLAQMTCPHCKAGIALRYREDSEEWTHDAVATRLGVVGGHTICWANGIRKAQLDG